MNKFVRVDMNKKDIKISEVKNKYKYKGGRLLTSSIINDEVPATCEPLKEKNKLIIAPGLLGGTSASSSGRLSIGAKSPLTNGIKESNSGGTFAKKLASLGYKAVIVEEQNKDDDWYILKITDSEMEVIKYNNIIGMDNYEACKHLRKDFGENIGIIIIGEAGEREYPIATCAITDREGSPARQAARGGLGAVMGSKGLKAIVVDDENAAGIKYNDKDKFRATVNEWSKELIEGKEALTKFGTAVLVNPMNEIGCMVTEKSKQGSFEGKENISGEKLAELQEERDGQPSHACMPGCVIRCSNVYNDSEGNHLTSSLEFETIVLNGSNLGIDNLDVIAKIDRFCDGFGLDTMDLGNAIAMAMETGYLSYGDSDAVLELLEKIKEDSLLGRIIAQGVAIAGKVLGADRIPEVKGQGISAYDPRALKGTGVTYATSPMGADHTAGNCLPGREGFTKAGKANLDPHDNKGKIDLSKEMQIMSAMCDALGLCIFVGTNENTAEKSASLLTALYENDFEVKDIYDLGRETIKAELEFNKKAGISNIKNKHNEFYSNEELPPKNLKWDVDENALRNIFDSLN